MGGRSQLLAAWSADYAGRMVEGEGQTSDGGGERAGRLRAEAALRESEARFHLLADSIPQLAWMARPDGWIFWYNKRWYDYTGTTLEEMEGWGWRNVHHPDHVDRVVARIQRSWQTGEPWEDTFPLKGRDGSWRWFLSRALPVHDDDGRVTCWFGTNTDITELREADERQKLLLAELNHRVKNTLAAVQSLAGQTLHSAASLEAFGDKFGGRLLALSRSHDLLARETWQGAALGELVAETLAPYRGEGAAARIALAGPAVRLAPTAAVTLGMAFHELSTNAAKYGALSTATGEVAVDWSIDWRGGKTPALEICWRESAGPPVERPPQSGFGVRLIEQGLALELSAEVRLDFAPDGLKCLIRLPLSAKVTVGPLAR
jgi:PAS domain S-box-containing protein